MKKQLLNSLFLLLFINGYCQDTIYSINYPKGIVTKSIEKKRAYYLFSPIDNPSIEVIMLEKNIFKVKYFSGEVFINSKTPIIDENDIVLPTELLTGKIFFSDIVKIEGAKAMKLYKSMKRLAVKPIENVYSEKQKITYTLIESDTTDYIYQKYIGNFIGYFAGDPTNIYFQLEIKFKDGKIKYEYSNFISISHDVYVSGRNSISTETHPDFFNPYKLTTTYSVNNQQNINITYKKNPDNLYASPKLTDVNSYWRPLSANIAESIEYLKKIVKEEPKVKKDDW